MRKWQYEVIWSWNCVSGVPTSGAQPVIIRILGAFRCESSLIRDRQDNVKYYHRKGSATITIAKTNLSKSSSATPSCATTARYFRCDRGQAAARLFLVLIPFPPPRVQLAGLNLHILNPDTFQQVWMPNPDGLILVIVARRMDTPENA